MYLKVISMNKVVKGINEPVYEVSYNDSRNFYIRKSSYERFTDGEYHLRYDSQGITLVDKMGDDLSMEFGVF